MRKIVLSVFILAIFTNSFAQNAINNCSEIPLGNTRILLQKFVDEDSQSFKTRIFPVFATDRIFFEEDDEIDVEIKFRDGTIINKKSSIFGTSIGFSVRIKDLFLLFPVPFPVIAIDQRNAVKPFVLSSQEEEIFKTKRLKQIKYAGVFLSRISKKYSLEKIKSLIKNHDPFDQFCDI